MLGTLNFIHGMNTKNKQTRIFSVGPSMVELCPFWTLEVCRGNVLIPGEKIDMFGKIYFTFTEKFHRKISAAEKKIKWVLL